MQPEQFQQVNTALFAYWTARQDAAAAQAARGVTDVGGRATATSGAHLDRVAQLFANVARVAGAPADQVYYSAPVGDPFRRSRVARGVTLPGYFRPDKKWDLVVWARGQPIVVVELKSQNGPSYGNNANNRAEEAIGNARDFQLAVDRSLIPGSPWVAYVFVIEEDERSRQPGRSSPALPTDPVFETWSYLERINQLSHRLVEEGLYQAAWPVATSRPTCPGRVRNSTGKIPCAQAALGIDPCAHKFSWRELDPDRNGYVRLVEQMTAKIKDAYAS